MSEKTRLTPLQVVERYHSKYVEYETAFNSEPFDKNEIEEKLKNLITKGVDPESEEFNDVIVSVMVEKPARRSDVDVAAMKFMTYASFFELTQEDTLPEHIEKDYKKLSENSYKFGYSIENGKFVKNEDTPVKLNKDYLKQVYKEIKSQMK